MRQSLLQLKRLIGIPTAMSDHEGQLRYDRDGAVAGQLRLARATAAGAYEWVAVSAFTPLAAVGPFFANDLAGTATTVLALGYYNTATALSMGTTDVRMGRAGTVIGLLITSDGARLTGSATGRIRINGTGTTFDSGTVAMEGASTATSDSRFVDIPSGLAFAGGDTLGVDIVTSGWTPTTANVSAWLYAAIDPFD